MTREGKIQPDRRYCLRGQINKAKRRFVLSEVLIKGETGTGKEAVALTLHFSSPRCAAGERVPKAL